MDISTILENEKAAEKNKSKLARRAAMVALLACSLMFILQFVFALFLPQVNGEIESILLDIGMYCVYLILPFALALLIYKKLFRSVKVHQVKRGSPKLPFLYIFGALGVGYLINFIVNFLFGWILSDGSSDVSATPESALGIFLYYILMSACPAILEEWAFRGILLKYLRPYGRLGAILISSILFGFMHVDVPRVIFATAFGFVLGVCYDYTGSIKLTVLIHFLNNAVAVTSSLFLDDVLASMLISIVILVLMGCGAGALAYYISMGLKRKKVSLDKPAVVGYKLSAGKFLIRAFLNFGTIPFLICYGFFFYLVYLI